MKAEKFWDNMADDFDQRAKKSELTRIKTLEKINKYLHTSDMVLDCGCATGVIDIAIADKVQQIHAIDISSKMIEAAKRNASERTILNIDFAQATIFDERYQRESFDVIVAYNVLHLLEDTEKAICRMKDLLKQGGMIISSTPCLGEKKFIKSLLFFPIKIGLIPNIRCFKGYELEELIIHEGFQLVEMKCSSQDPIQYFIAAQKI